MKTLSDFSATTIEGKEAPLSQYSNQVCLIVNVASRCGFTPQYSGLELLYKKFKDRGFTILAFPCNQFGAQEPGSEAEIKGFCEMNYQITFPLFSKIDVNGPSTHPLYAWLKTEKKGILGSEGVKWNFTKFLVGKDGQVIKRFAPTDKPESLASEIEKAL